MCSGFLRAQERPFNMPTKNPRTILLLHCLDDTAALFGITLKRFCSRHGINNGGKGTLPLGRKIMSILLILSENLLS